MVKYVYIFRNTSPKNSSLHSFGIIETKLKTLKLSTCFNIDGQAPFRKNNDNNGGGVLLFMSGMASMLDVELI